MKRLKRILIICLTCVLVLNAAYKPIKADAAEAGIIGGALAAAGVTLTFGQIALIVAAAGGCVYLYQNREAIAESLENYLDSVAENVENGAEELKKWWDRAVLGYIAIDTAADFIKNGVKEWVEGLHNEENLPFVSGNGYDHLGRRLAVSGSSFSGIVPVGLGEDDYVSGSDTVYRFYYITQNTESAFGCYFAVLFTKNKVFSMRTPEGTTTCTDYYGGYRYGGYITHVSATTEDDIRAAKLLMQGCVENEYIGTVKGMMEDVYAGRITGEPLPMGQSICPDSLVGGIPTALEEGHTIDDVNLPDLVIDGTGSICPDTTLTGEDVFAQSISDTMTDLQTGTMTWSDYVADVGVAAPTITLPDTEDTTATKDYVITDTGVSDMVVESTTTTVPELDQYKVQLRDFFPFCLPFDMVDFLTVLAADPEAPVFELQFPALDGETLEFTVDLSPWDGVAQLLRNLELLALIIGLCFKTRDIIRS